LGDKKRQTFFAKENTVVIFEDSNRNNYPIGKVENISEGGLAFEYMDLQYNNIKTLQLYKHAPAGPRVPAS
jgi:hypothetical protein